MVDPIFCLLIGNTRRYFELTVQAIKYLKRNIPTANIGVISPPSHGELKDVLENRLKELEPSLNLENLHYISGNKHFNDWGNSQHILDVQIFAEEFDPIVFLDSDTVVLKDLTPFIENFKALNKKFAFLSDYINDYPDFRDNWEGEYFIPQTSFIIFKSQAVPRFFKTWESNWKEWVEPVPFARHKNPARFYDQSTLAINQYSLGQSIYKYVKNFDQDVLVIDRNDLKIARNLGVEPQKVKAKFLGAGSSFSNAGPSKINLTVLSGKVNKSRDVIGKGDPFVTVKVGDVEKQTRVIKNTKTPVWNEDFIFENPTPNDASTVLLTLSDWDSITSSDLIGTANLSLVDGSGEPEAGQHYSLPVVDKRGKEQGKLDINGEYVVEDGPEEEEEEIVNGVAPQKRKKRAPKTRSFAPPAKPVEEDYTGKKKVLLTIVSAKIYNKHDVTTDDDPYVTVKLAGVEKKTSTKQGTQNPKWNETLAFDSVPASDAQTAEIVIYDEDKFTKDDLIGSATVSVAKRGHQSVSLIGPKSGRKGGKEEAVVEIDVDLQDPSPVAALPPPPTKSRSFSPQAVTPKTTTPKPVTPKPVTPSPVEEGEEYSGGKTATINVISAKIYKKHDLIGKDDPFVKITIAGVEKQTTIIKDNQNPVWNEVVIFDNVPASAAKNAVVTIWDADSITSNDLIGTGNLSLLAYVNRKKGERVSLPLKNKKNVEEAVVELEISLNDPVAPEPQQEVEEEVEEPVVPTKTREFQPPAPPAPPETNVKAVISVWTGKVHHKQDVFQNGDPFLKFNIGAIEERTNTCKNTLTPTWNDEFSFDQISSTDASAAVVTLWDEDTFSSADLIGTGNLDLLAYKNRGKKHVSLPINDKKGKEQAVIELDVEVTDSSDSSTLKSRDFLGASGLAAVTGTTVKERGVVEIEKKPTKAAKAEPKIYTPGDYHYLVTVSNAVIHKTHDLTGKDDAFAKVKIGNAEKSTRVIDNTQTPEWNEKFAFLDQGGDAVADAEVSIWDHDSVSANDLIGTGSLPIKGLTIQEGNSYKVSALDEDSVEQAIINVSAKRVSRDAAVQYKITQQLASAPKEKAAKDEKPYKGTGKAVLTISKGKINKPLPTGNPNVQVKIGNQAQQTKSVPNTQSPVWNETLTLPSVSADDVQNKATLILWDQDAVTGKSEPIGSAPLSGLLAYKNNKKKTTVPVYDEQGEKIGTIDLEAEVQVAPPNYVGEKNIVLNIVSATIHKSHDVVGKDDAFVKVKVGDTVKQTRVIENSQEPVWNEDLVIEDINDDALSDITVELWDYDSVSKNDIIGSTSISVDTARKKVHSLPLINDKGIEEAILNLSTVLVSKEQAQDTTIKKCVAAAPKSKEKEKGIDYPGTGKLLLNIVSAKVPAGNEHPSVKVNVGTFDQKTNAQNSKAPVWNTPLNFTGVKADDVKNVTVSLLEEPTRQKRSVVGAGTVSVLQFLDKKGHVSVPVYNDQGEKQGVVEIDAEVSISTLGTAVFKIATGKVKHSHDTFGKGDPYVIVRIGEVEKRTQIKMNTLEPRWNENLYLENVKFNPVVQAEILMYDHDDVGSDDFIGGAKYDIYNKCNPGASAIKEGAFELRDAKGAVEATLVFEVSRTDGSRK